MIRVSAGVSEKDVSRRRVSTDCSFRFQRIFIIIIIIIIIIPSCCRDLFVFNLRDQSHTQTRPTRNYNRV